MLPIILGGVALATVGYGMKKCIIDDECQSDSDNNTIELDFMVEPKSTKKSKRFHKLKKSIYMTSMQTYRKFLKSNKILDKNNDTQISKLIKEKFDDNQIDESSQKLINQITDTLEILSQNLISQINLLNDGSKIDKKTKSKLKKYAHSIYELSNINIFSRYSILNKAEIDSLLVEAMMLLRSNNTEKSEDLEEEVA